MRQYDLSAPGRTRTPSRARRIRDALRACSSAFNIIHDELERTAATGARKHLQALLGPFVALLQRYPAKARTSAEEVAGADEVDEAEAPETA